jgi:hypothetical protein
VTAVPHFIRAAGWTAYAAGVATLATTLWLSAKQRERIAKKRVAAALAVAAVPPDAWRDGDEIVVRGRLDAERAVSAVALMGFADGDEQIELTHDAVDGATLDCGGIPLALGEPLAVLVGSHVIRHHEIPPERFTQATVGRDRIRRATEMKMWHGGVEGYHMRRVKPGDEVLARGRLARADDGWRLEPIGRRAIELTALAGVVDPVQLPPQSAMGRAVVFGAAAFLAAAYLGSIAG